MGGKGLNIHSKWIPKTHSNVRVTPAHKSWTGNVYANAGWYWRYGSLGKSTIPGARSIDIILASGEEEAARAAAKGLVLLLLPIRHA